MSLNKHLPSHVNIAGYRALVSYEGQPQTCYGCGHTDHMYQMCPKRRSTKPNRYEPSGPTWAQRTAADPPCMATPEHRNSSETREESELITTPQSHHDSMTACNR
jgi:hypothetical protein